MFFTGGAIVVNVYLMEFVISKTTLRDNTGFYLFSLCVVEFLGTLFFG